MAQLQNYRVYLINRQPVNNIRSKQQRKTNNYLSINHVYVCVLLCMPNYFMSPFSGIRNPGI